MPPENSAPLIFSKDLGKPVSAHPADLTTTNADDRPVVRPSDGQKYTFDARGWLLIPGVLSEDEIEEMRDFCYRLHNGDETIPEHQRFSIGGPLEKLTDHPVVVGFMNEFVAHPLLANESCYGFRMEGSYLIIRTAGFHRIGPHNGNGMLRLPGDSHFYRCIPGKAHSGLTRVVWELAPVGEGDGSTRFISGSHKAAYPAPESVQDGSSPLWETYSCPAGSVLFFTEATTHTGAPWTNEAWDRVPVFNSYNTVNSKFHDWNPHPQHLESMPAKRQTLFRPVHFDQNVTTEV